MSDLIVERALVLGRGYTVLIADLERSRRLPDRAHTQQETLALLAALSKTYAGDLLTPLDLTAGDEIQAIMRTPSTALHLLTALRAALRPVRLHAGVGFGPLETGTAGTPVRHMDGPCFHRARQALEHASRKGDHVALRGFPPLDTLLSANLHLAFDLEDAWTETQVRYIDEHRRRGSVNAVADAAGVSASTVSQTLSRSRWTTLETIHHETARLLDTHWRAPTDA